MRQARRQWRGLGVHIATDASLQGLANLTIGAGTCIHDGAIVAASSLYPPQQQYDKPSGSIRIGQRCIIGRGAIIASYGGDIEIGDDVSINPYCVVYGHGGLFIGDKTRIATQTVIIPANHVISELDVPIMSQGIDCQGIRIGSNTWIGAGARILDGVEIGNDAVIGAGAVVTKQVPNFAVAMGVPASVVRDRRETAQGHESLPVLA